LSIVKPKLLSVDGILKTFTKTIAKLEACEANHETHAASCAAQAEALTKASDDSKAEAERARAVKAKIAELIGG